MRLLVLLAAALVLGAAAAAARAQPRIVVAPDVPTGAHLTHRPAAHAAQAALIYGGGPVLHANRTHVVFWQPAGSGFSFDPGYETLIETFLQNVAADSHLPTNVYSLSGQYRDGSGPAAYDSSYGGAVIDTDPLPGNGCLEPLLTGPGWLTCVSGTQLEDELEQVIVTRGLPQGPGEVYFLLTPAGLGSCIGSGPENCALGGTSSGGYCGYHSLTTSGIAYALIPYNALAGHCQSGDPRPNSNSADPAISTISHEHNEIVTDPTGTAWSDASGKEDGDLCLTSFGAAIGGSGASAYNQLIGGGHYYLQDEWSNDDGSCQPRDETDFVKFTAPHLSTTGTRIWLSADGKDPDGAIKRYEWNFGDGTTSSGRRPSHVFKRSGSYRITVRSTDSADNYAFYSASIRVNATRRQRSGRH